MSSVCQSCRKEVIFVKTVHGKMMPIERDDNGNMIVVNAIAHVIPKGQEPVASMQRFVSHFANCPFAKRHRQTASPKAVASV